MLIAGDECCVDENYAQQVPLGPGLLWSERAWFESLVRLKDIERRTGADVLYGHDLELRVVRSGLELLTYRQKRPYNLLISGLNPYA